MWKPTLERKSINLVQEFHRTVDVYQKIAFKFQQQAAWSKLNHVLGYEGGKSVAPDQRPQHTKNTITPSLIFSAYFKSNNVTLNNVLRQNKFFFKGLYKKIPINDNKMFFLLNYNFNRNYNCRKILPLNYNCRKSLPFQSWHLRSPIFKSVTSRVRS